MEYSPKNIVISYDDDIGAMYYIPTSQLVELDLPVAKELECQLQSGKISEKYKTQMDKIFTQSPKTKYFLDDFLKMRELSKLEMVVSTCCNLNCVYCYANQGTFNQPKQLMSKDMAKLIIDRTLQYVDKIKCVQFFGGEPTLAYPTVEYICSLLNSKLPEKPAYVMSTNFVDIDFKMMKSMIENDIRLTVSIDGPQDIHDKLRPYSNSDQSTYAKIKQNIETFHSLGGRINAIECTYTNNHVKMGYSPENLKIFLQQTFNVENILIYNNENELSEGSAQLIEFGFSYLDSQCISNFMSKQKDMRHCGAGFEMIAYFPNGDIYPCHKFALHNNKMGNIQKINWVSMHEFANLRNKLNLLAKCSISSCSLCNFRTVCHQCLYSIIYNKQSIQCKNIKRNLSAQLLYLVKSKRSFA